MEMRLKQVRSGLQTDASVTEAIYAAGFASSSRFYENLENRLREKFSKATILDNDDIFKTWVKQVLAHLESPQRTLGLPLDVQGTAFQRLVWTALREIPPGSTASYADIASKIGRPKAARAVARACATNKIAVAIPCHRAVRRDGGLGGYRWGMERKRAVLEREADLNKLSFSTKIESDPKLET
jgi:AraC family transcriptional regulator of adaptative response/methylated-DNA-[protein]-cysteine methyltransferase